MGKCRWIGLPPEQTSGRDTEVLYFRRVVTANQADRLHLRLCAEHRYELYINGALCGRGPARGRETIRFYDAFDFAGLLRTGANCVAVRVVHYPGAFPLFDGEFGPASLFRKTMGALALEGAVSGAERTVDIGSSSEWMVKKETGISFTRPRRAMWATNYEEHFCQKIDYGFLSADSNDGWRPAYEITESLLNPHPLKDYGQHYAFELRPSPVPPMRETEGRFVKVSKAGDARMAGLPLRVPPHTALWFDLDAGELVTAYPRLRTRSGEGATIRLTYAECYYVDPEAGIKGVRDDVAGELGGETDVYHPDGGDRMHSTAIYRTFRFVRVAVQTAEQALDLVDFTFIHTGYPLDVAGGFACDNDRVNAIFDVSLRTLRRCMHDTYIDCPFYEQLQYVLDTRLEALFTYQLSRDDRLARRAMEDFRASMQPDGLIGSRYPSAYPQRIPSFALHFVFMLHDHMLYFGDRGWLLEFLPVLDAIFTYFLRRRKENGLVCAEDAWGFIDWVDGWKLNSVPPLEQGEGMTVLSEMAACALLQAAEIAAFCGRDGLQLEYERAGRALNESIVRACYDPKTRLFRDGDAGEQYSEHAQLWAVLCGAVSIPEGRSLLERMRARPMPGPSFSHSFYRNRALEKAGLYEETPVLFREYARMLDLHATTWMEDAVTQRSDCHGWGSVPLYELPAVVAGIRPAGPGFREAVVRPRWDESIRRYSASVPAAAGVLCVRAEHENGRYTLAVETPVPATVILPGGRRERIESGGAVYTGEKEGFA